MTKSPLAALAVLAFLYTGIPGSSGQTASFAYNDGVGTPNAGSYAPGSSFTFSISLTFTAGGTVANLEGLSYWFEQQNASGPFNFSITQRNVTGSQFTLLQTPGLTYPQALSPQSANDLGATLQGTTGIGNGTYFIANITISISPSAAPGVYLIENTTNIGKRSVVSDDQGHTFAIPQSTYAITVVPEPASMAYLALAGVGAAGWRWLRQRR